MTRQRLLGAIDQLKVWKRGAARAPHKPLTLLWMLGRVRHGERRQASYAQDAHKPIGDLLREAANRILYEHFPESMHDAIRDQVGLPRDSMVRGSVAREGEATARSQRDPEFRHAVLRAYERRCTVCGFDLEIAGDLFAVEAAHIMWHALGGPDQVPNGLALCTLHHKALDSGVIGLEREAGTYRLLVSNELSGQSSAFSELLDFRGKPLRPPQEEVLLPAAEFIAWHRQEVFRGEPRSRPQ